MATRYFCLLIMFLLNFHNLIGQNFYDITLDTSIYTVDTLPADDKIEIIYTNHLKKSEFRVFFKSTPNLVPDGICIYTDSCGTVIKGQYTDGVMSGYWIEENKKKSYKKGVNYDFKIKFIPRDSLRYRGKYRIDIPSQEVYLVERMPEFQGKESFNRYIKKMTFIPPSFRFFSNGKKRVVVRFVVNVYGEVFNIEAIRGGDNDDLNREALRIINLSPKWSPGSCNEKATDVEMVFPVQFLVE